jgi:hypothetical protein
MKQKKIPEINRLITAVPVFRYGTRILRLAFIWYPDTVRYIAEGYLHTVHT